MFRYVRGSYPITVFNADTVELHFFEPLFHKHRRFFKLYFKSRLNSYTIALFELLIIQTFIIRTLELSGPLVS